MSYKDFPGGSDGKESTCNVGDLDSIPGSEDRLEKGMATHSQYSCLENPHGQRSLAAYVHGVAESATTEQLSTAFIHLNQKHLQRVSSVLGPVRGGLFHVVN